ncbi:MAG TPA: DUF1330 domain-containing protein [Deltaproteobacteria bacterium]|nr:DUF1330 domain-containing protein [Deltaproteobacteria bacterium]
MAEDEKIYMLNVLWFKPDGGAGKYAEYATAAAPFVQALGGRMIDGFIPEQSLIGEWEPDLFFIVEWPSLEAFLQLPLDPGYQAIAHLREEALRDSLLIRCRRAATPP